MFSYFALSSNSLNGFSLTQISSITGADLSRPMYGFQVQEGDRIQQQISPSLPPPSFPHFPLHSSLCTSLCTPLTLEHLPAVRRYSYHWQLTGLICPTRRHSHTGLPASTTIVLAAHCSKVPYSIFAMSVFWACTWETDACRGLDQVLSLLALYQYYLFYFHTSIKINVAHICYLIL